MMFAGTGVGVTRRFGSRADPTLWRRSVTGDPEDKLALRSPFQPVSEDSWY